MRVGVYQDFTCTMVCGGGGGGSSGGGSLGNRASITILVCGLSFIPLDTTVVQKGGSLAHTPHVQFCV